jgi:hypothetical protein
MLGHDCRRCGFQDNRHTAPLRNTIRIPYQGPDGTVVCRARPEFHLYVGRARLICKYGAVPDEAGGYCVGGRSAIAGHETDLLGGARSWDDVQFAASDGGCCVGSDGKGEIGGVVVDCAKIQHGYWEIYIFMLIKGLTGYVGGYANPFRNYAHVGKS